MRRDDSKSVFWSACFASLLCLGVGQILSGCNAIEDVFHPPDAVGIQESEIGEVNFRLKASVEDGVVAYLIHILQDGVAIEERLQVLDTEALPSPMAGGDNHRFADAYFTLAPGQYDIIAQPMAWDEATQEHVGSKICTEGTSENVEVKPGETTEVVIFSQCNNPGNGGLDVVVTINHAPIIEDIVFEPSKFIVACEEVVVRTTINEPDEDEYTISWDCTEPVGAAFDLVENGELLSFIAETPGDYEVSLTVCDALSDPHKMCTTFSMPIHVTLGEDENGNGIGDRCELEVCEPKCEDRECGPDPECGESCGTCGDNENCSEDSGICECDFEQCNGVCCAEGEVCENDLCTECLPPSCADMGKECGSWVDDNCGNMIDCGSCEDGKVCSDEGQCACQGVECNGVCCGTEESCVEGQCQQQDCVPKTCEELEKECGSWPDDCGGQVECATCPSNEICTEVGVCKIRAGRVVTILLTLSNPRTNGNDPDHVDRTKLITQSVNWVSPVDTPKVLIVRDDSHFGEFWRDPKYIRNRMASQGLDVKLVNEPACGLMPSDLEPFDVVWFSNPGHPVDDKRTVRTLRKYVFDTGGGLILQGDDMSWRKDMESLTYLHFNRNGTYYCSAYINDNKGGSYQVTYESAAHPVIDGLQEKKFLYGDDIDHTNFICDPKAQVLAWATLPNFYRQDSSSQCKKMPVIVAFDPHDTPD